MVLMPVLGVFVIICYVIYYVLTKDSNYWKKRNVPGPKPSLFFGNIKESVLRRQPLPEVLRGIYEQYPDEKLVGLFRMKTPHLLIRDPDILRHIFIKDFDNFVDRGQELSKEGLGANLFHADGESWRVLRQKFTPMFTSGKLKNMLYLIVKRGDLLVDYIHEQLKINSEVPVKYLIQRYTMSSIAATAFGMDIDYNNKEIFEELDVIDKNIFTVNYSVELDMMFPGILKKVSASLFPAIITKFFRNLVKSVSNQRNGKPTGRNDFMDLMLAMKEAGTVSKKTESGDLNLEITDNLMAAQAFVFYAAGYETSATTSTFLTYQMAINPDVQDRLIAHIDEVLARHNNETTYECLSELTYLQRVIDETLRIYPIVDPLQRNAEQNYKVPGTDVVIEKGHTVLISAGGIHHDKKYFPNPEKFDPDRFLPENSRDRHPCAYLPFGVGPRNCIGNRYALVQTKIFLAKFFSNFRVEPTRNTIIPMKFDGTKILLSAVGGVQLKIVPRKKDL